MPISGPHGREPTANKRRINIAIVVLGVGDIQSVFVLPEYRGLGVGRRRNFSNVEIPAR